VSLPTHIRYRGRAVALKYHRLLSGRGLHPPNSLSALEEVLEGGAGVIEFDVRLLGDGTWVLHHDPTLERETSGVGPLGLWDRERFKALRLRGFEEPPALLEEVVERLAGVDRPLKVQVDLKEERPLSPEAARSFLEGLAPLRANPRLQVVVGGLADWNLRALLRLDPALPVGLDFAFHLDAPVGPWPRLPQRVNAYGYLDDHPLGFLPLTEPGAYLEDRLEVLLHLLPRPVEVYLRKEFLVQALRDGVNPVAFIHQRLGVPVDVWTLNPEEPAFSAFLEAALDAGADQITTDSPLGLVREWESAS